MIGEGPELIEQEAPAEVVGILGSAVYDLPVEANSWVEAEVNFLSRERPHVIQRWLERGDQYEEFVTAVLKNEGLPADLRSLAMIESGYLPTARSHAGAVGIWQFMAATARHAGLRVEEEVDERMDPVRSTRAAARHLRWLHRSLGDWALAAAAYNAGSGRISRGMEATGAKSFWELAVWGDLADETKHYVPRLYAMTIIAKDRQRFGLPGPAAEVKAFAFDSIEVDLATPLSLLAASGGVALSQLSELNPHLIAGRTPEGRYWVWTPRGTGETMQAAFSASAFRAGGGMKSYRVRKGDHAARLAERGGVNVGDILDLNPGIDWDNLKSGQKLALPAAAVARLAAAAEEQPARRKAEQVIAAEGERRPAAATHTVRNGETLWEIARRYRVGVESLQRENELTGSKILPGQTLKLPGGTPAEAAAPATQYTVKSGDTLWGIARTHGCSVAALREQNGLGSVAIRPGQRLTIPVATN